MVVLERLVVGRGLGKSVDVFVGECNGGGGLELPDQRVLNAFPVALVRAEPVQIPARPHWTHRRVDEVPPAMCGRVQ